MTTAPPDFRRWLNWCLCLVVAVISLSELALGFTSGSSVGPAPRTAPSFGCRRISSRRAQTPLRMAAEFEAPEAAMKQNDPNGNEFVEGAVVRVAVPTKAYQVPAKGHGKFDPETKEFIPVLDGVERVDKCLEVPVGLRGVVKKVIDANDLSANLPVQVKFAPGKNTEEGYDSPVAFLMHFQSNELEVVVD